MMAKNKISKYLIYAIGEIVLVVIGILIALQINNWNQYKNERIFERSLLEKIAENITKDIDQYENVIIVEQNMIARNDSFLQIIRNPLSYDNDKLDNYIGYLRLFRKFIPNKSALTNLISSGKINIIENNELLDQILLYYNTMDTHGAGVDAALTAYTRNQIGPYIMNFDFMNSSALVSDFRKRKSLLEYHEDPAIDNLVSFKIQLGDNQIRQYEEQIVNAKNLLKAIRKEIK